MDIQYVGEHLLPGNIGRFAIILGFISAFLSSFFYLQASRENPADTFLWKKWGRYAFFAHSFFIILASTLLMYILLYRFYEYRYVWVHVENDLGLGYHIASFWAGQEGSFLFWNLCQVIVGLLLIRFAGNWEKPVMVTVALSQVFMTSMLLGISFGSFDIGMSPFLLLREVPENAASEFFRNPYYLALIVDGNGLNPLLRNFWMLSHPPVLFVGFAMAMVPFAYAFAGLWKKKYTQWIAPALPWTHLTIFFLGAGILLGGVWAYESLTFGGFWAWDPIENASLVPWLIIVAALHLMLVAKKKSENLFPALLFTALAFVFVIYSTYLTRSGVLAETSVHSFGNDGMGFQILSYLFTFLILFVILLAKRYSKLPSSENDEPMSRQFWLFISAMVLVLSAFQIIFTTSIPVINRIFGSALTPPVNVVQHYNTWQLPFAVMVALLMGFAHFLKWGKNDLAEFARKTLIALGLSLVFTLLIVFSVGSWQTAHIVFLFAALFAMFSSLDMLLRFKNVLANTPTIVSHLGIALFLLAILLTFSQQETISKNTSGYFLGEAFPESENLLLIKDEILPMGNYHVTYKGNYKEGEDIFYIVDFLQKNKDGEFFKVFRSTPSIKLNESMGNVYNPFAKVYLNKDIFTYITFANLDHHDHSHEPPLLASFEMTLHDTLHIDNNHMVLSAIEANNEGQSRNERVTVEATIDIITHYGKTFQARPRFILQGNSLHYHDDAVRDLDYRFRFSEVSDKAYTIKIDLYQEEPEFIIIKTIIFPYINLLWFSCILMLVGFWMAFRKRWKSRNKQ